MQKKQLGLIHLTILLCLSVFAFSTHSIANQNDGLLKIYFFDVGQGDSVLIISPNQNQILIDGGPDNKVLEKLGEVIPFYDKDLDLVILTHPHADHLTGLLGVLERYNIKNIMEAKEIYDSPQFEAWENAVKSENANNIEAIAGTTVNLGNDVYLKILHPFQSVTGTKTTKPHDDVVVAMLEYKSFKVLLTGDMEAKVENKLLLTETDLDADVLKVGHHGSKTSATKEFLNKTSPQVAVIQVGAKNRYGHPSPEVLKRLDDYDIKYYRTDVNGDVKIVSDGESFKIISIN